MVTFGKWLRNHRKSLKLTMKQLGEKVGLTESAIGMIERDERKPSFESLIKIEKLVKENYHKI